MNITDDDGAVTEPELGSVVLADPDPLDEAEGVRQPGNRLSDVRVDQDRYHC
jgi:hypothetical protein